MLDVDINVKRDDFCLQVCTKLEAPITGILGASGSGKSTFLAVIAGLLKPQQGYIQLNDQRLFDAKTNLWSPPHKRRIGLVFQDGQLLPHLSVHNNLLYGYRNITQSERHFELNEVAKLLEIEHLLDRKATALSGGEKQRVALGRAILYSPSVLLMDEPLSSLDERLKNQILPFFLRIKSECKIPMVYVTHSPRELDFLTDTQLVMSDGQLLANGN
ncbi:molybdenum ABC transporter ATP-binding protein [Cellvibrio zantedeschiae]|uniref:Molybdenum ABC transporter ATP-binding protein n=1 Tax=Cellvibrio zantedeschiae TaxID=1237077 RepID=A0ABQ3AQR5_9GAMM|nr:ATP-binding cassette domain-containing protein [Cellvibrio zantedeschiae]GGY62678.1 molybdenum ABC transporter ATP-binding protein [Cellvibrio zantedeschiae]